MIVCSPCVRTKPFCKPKFFLGTACTSDPTDATMHKLEMLIDYSGVSHCTAEGEKKLDPKLLESLLKVS